MSNPTPRPFASVVVPFYGSLDQLRACLDALQAQTYPRDRFEIILVNNGWPGDLSALQTDFPDVQWLWEPTPGSFRARNTGVRAARGAVIALTDSDCLPVPTWLEAGVRNLQSGAPRLLAGRVNYQETGRLNLYAMFEQEFFMLHRQKFLVEALNVAATANLFAWRAVFEEVGYFDPVLLQWGDGEWTQRMVRQGETLGYCDDALILHPRRSTFREIFVKVRRFGDRITLARMHGATPWQLLGEVYQGSILDVREYVRFFRAKRTSQDRVVLLVAFAMLMSLVGTFEKIRVLCGGRPYRK